MASSQDQPRGGRLWAEYMEAEIHIYIHHLHLRLEAGPPYLYSIYLPLYRPQASFIPHFSPPLFETFSPCSAHSHPTENIVTQLHEFLPYFAHSHHTRSIRNLLHVFSLYSGHSQLSHNVLT
jgi:hypothetical protein